MIDSPVRVGTFVLQTATGKTWDTGAIPCWRAGSATEKTKDTGAVLNALHWNAVRALLEAYRLFEPLWDPMSWNSLECYVYALRGISIIFFRGESVAEYFCGLRALLSVCGQ